MAPDTYRRRAWELAVGQYGYVTAADAHTTDLNAIIIHTEIVEVPW